MKPTEAEITFALLRADRLVQWMTNYIGNMAPGKYGRAYAELNEHGLFMQGAGLVQPDPSKGPDVGRGR